MRNEPTSSAGIRLTEDDIPAAFEEHPMLNRFPDGSGSLIVPASVCNWCFDQIEMIEGGDSLHRSTYRHHPTHRDPLPHHPEVLPECLSCGFVKADLLVMIDAFTIMLCCGCASAVTLDPEAVRLQALDTVVRRRMVTDFGYIVSIPDAVERNVNRVIQLLHDAQNTVSMWVGPRDLWVSSGIRVTDFRKIKVWMDKLWERMLRELDPGNKIHCPPHMEDEPGECVTALSKVVDLGRAQTRAAEPVWISKDLTAQILSRATALPSGGYDPDIAIDALQGERVGLLVFDRPVPHDYLLTVIAGIQYALVPGGVWIVPLTHARGLKSISHLVPDHALAQISAGYFLRALNPDKNSGMDRQSELISRLLVAFWELANEPATVSTTTGELPEETVKVGKRKNRTTRVKALPYRVSELRRPDLTEEAVSDLEGATTRGTRGPLVHRHKVRAHKRRVWVGKKGNRHLEERDIEEFWQGPEDAPEAPPKESYRKMTR